VLLSKFSPGIAGNSNATSFYLSNSRILRVFALTETTLIAIMTLGVRFYLLPLVIGVVCVAGAASGQFDVRSGHWSYEGRKMKKALVSVVLVIIVCSLVFGLSGCARLGETKAEARIRHKRVARIRKQQLRADIDTVMLYDEPSKLTEKKLP
jgi:hypothetical protein